MWNEAAYTVAGAVLMKLVDWVTGSSRWRQDELAQVRQELHRQVAALSDQMEALRREVDTWQAKYYDLRIELEVQRRENDLLQQEVGRLRRRLQQTESDAGPLEGPAAVPGGAER